MENITMSEEKLDFTLLCTKFLRGMTRVMEDGMKKPGRGPDAWKDLGPNFDKERIKSLLRHTMNLLEGEMYDEESGLPNIDHIAANCMIIRYHQVKEGKIVDNPVDDIKLEITEETKLFCADFNDVNIWPQAPGTPDANNPCLEKRLDKERLKYYNDHKLPTKDYNDGQ